MRKFALSIFGILVLGAAFPASVQAQGQGGYAPGCPGAETVRMSSDERARADGRRRVPKEVTFLSRRPGPLRWRTRRWWLSSIVALFHSFAPIGMMARALCQYVDPALNSHTSLRAGNLR